MLCVDDGMTVDRRDGNVILRLLDLLWICCGFVVQVVGLVESCGFVVDLLRICCMYNLLYNESTTNRAWSLS
jgi:hypothetical protein